MLYLFHAAVPTLCAMYYEIFMEKTKKNPLVYVGFFCFLLLVNVFFGAYIYSSEASLKEFKFNIPNGVIQIISQGICDEEDQETSDNIYYVSMNGNLCPYSCKTKYQATIVALSMQWALFEEKER